MQRRTTTRIAGGALILGALAWTITAPAVAQEESPLPAEVRAWLEADQLRRWADQLERGEKLFSEGSCAKCHGQGGTNGRFAPDLTDDEWLHSDGSLVGIRDTIFWGVRKQDLSDPERPFMTPTGSMRLEWADLQAVAAYVWSLSHGTHLPKEDG